MEALTPNQVLRNAIAAIGSQSETARLLELTQGAVSRWINEGKSLPAEHVLAVEAATGISRHDLRPDLYPRGPAPIPTPDRRPAAMEPAR